MNEYKGERQFLLLLDYFRENPALMLSVSYLLLTLCGIFYSKEFYNNFDINILQFAEISDLLIVGINEPRAVMMFAGGLAVAYGIDRLYPISYKIRQKWQPKPKSIKRTLVLWVNYAPKNNDISLLFSFLFIFIAYGYLFVSLFAESRADELKSSGHFTYIVEAEMIDKKQEFVLLGTTTNYVLLYDQQRKQSVITPVDKIEKLIPVVKEEPDETSMIDKLLSLIKSEEK